MGVIVLPSAATVHVHCVNPTFVRTARHGLAFSIAVARRETVYGLVTMSGETEMSGET